MLAQGKKRNKTIATRAQRAGEVRVDRGARGQAGHAHRVRAVRDARSPVVVEERKLRVCLVSCIWPNLARGMQLW
jgi:hypothetical protein